MTEWKMQRIGNLGRVITGRTPPTKDEENFGTTYPFITPSDMDGRRTIDTTERYISEVGAEVIKSCRVPSRSVAVSCIGWQMGKVVLTARDSFTNQQINTILPNEKVIPEFLYYALSTMRPELKLLASVGTRTPILKKSAFEQVEVSIPPLPTQRRIAAILSAYDDLIENNTRRIKALEQAAHDLYREWFVHFSFPGHESVEMVDSGTDYGMTPHGWEVVPLGELADMKYGKMPKKDKRTEVGYPIFSGYGIVGHYPEYLYEEPKITIVARGVGGAGNVVMSPPFAYVTNLSIVLHTLKNGIQERFLYHRLIDTTVWNLRTGSAQAQITIDHLKTYEILLPDETIQNDFTDKVIELEDLAENLRKKNNALREARDLLLPRLVSGQLDVDGLEIMEE